MGAVSDEYRRRFLFGILHGSPHHLSVAFDLVSSNRHFCACFDHIVFISGAKGCRLTPRSQRRLPLEFMIDLDYKTIIESAEPLAGRRGSGSLGHMKPLLLTVILSVAVPAFSQDMGVGYRFPSDTHAASPDGKWNLKCTNPRDHWFSLQLQGGAGRAFHLLDFDRGCNALWSPDSSHIAITDWASSSGSDMFIYSVAHPTSKIAVRTLFPTNSIPTAEWDGHCYLEATKWLDAHRVQIRVSGHTDEWPVRPFEHSFVFDIKSQTFERGNKRWPNN